MTQPTPLVTSPSLQSVLAAADLARTQSLAILDLLDAHHASSSTSTTTDSSSATAHQLALSTQQKKLTAHLAHLRGLNRKAVLGVRSTKQETGEARQEIDALHLQLQNLYYEQRHLRGEIAGCEDYEYVACLVFLVVIECACMIQELIIFVSKQPHVQQPPSHDAGGVPGFTPRACDEQ
jgi:THO complex subunit 5